MRYMIFFLSLFCVMLPSCHQDKKARPRNVISDDQSVVNKWYGQKHFYHDSPEVEKRSINRDYDDETTEFEAGPEKQKGDSGSKNSLDKTSFFMQEIPADSVIDLDPLSCSELEEIFPRTDLEE